MCIPFSKELTVKLHIIGSSLRVRVFIFTIVWHNQNQKNRQGKVWCCWLHYHSFRFHVNISWINLFEFGLWVKMKSSYHETQAKGCLPSTKDADQRRKTKGMRKRHYLLRVKLLTAAAHQRQCFFLHKQLVILWACSNQEASLHIKWWMGLNQPSYNLRLRR